MNPPAGSYRSRIARQGRFLSPAGYPASHYSLYRVGVRWYAGFSLSLFSLFLFLLLLPVSHATAKEPHFVGSGLIWPLDPPYVFTSTFGEHRPDRFHAGLDFSTGGEIGRPCYAVGDGFVTRVKVSFNERQMESILSFSMTGISGFYFE